LVDLDLTIVREESPTSTSILSSYPSTPALHGNSSELDSDSKNQSENTLPVLRPLSDEYHLSNRKFRQLSPLEQKSTVNASLTVDNTTEGFINHAYSTESLYNQLPTTDSTLSPPPPLTATDSTPPSSTTSVSPSPQILPRTLSENFRHMCSVICVLMKNTRFVCIVIANLFEGILIKGKSCIL
jgi:hypothetical protein